MKRYDKLFYDGNWQAAHSEKLAEVINPTTEEAIAQVIQADHEDIDRAVAAAKEAFPAWNETAPFERAVYLKRILAGLTARKEEIADVIVQELGASRSFSEQGQVGLALKELQATLEELADFPFEEEIDNATIIKEGFGVVACITPWNYPLNQIQRKITPALLTGNTVVVKPASNTPLTAILYAEIIQEAGLPAGVFNLVTGSGSDAGNYLAEHEDVAVVSFTGSTAVGKKLSASAAATVKKTVLELGGKSAMIYLPGGDLALAVKLAASTVLDNQGQTCSALTRLLVPEDMLAKTKTALKDYYENVTVGNPAEPTTRVGPVVSEEQLKTVLDYIEIGKKEGAEVLIGGKAIEETGYFVEPTVFINGNNQMRIAREEIFGPVLTVLTYSSVAEAITIANDSDYGLSGGVVGPEEAAYEVAKKMRTGNVIINGSNRTPKAPFGGYKQSGIGRENGRFGLEDYVEIKAVFHG